jgi:hypothetical protein
MMPNSNSYSVGDDDDIKDENEEIGAYCKSALKKEAAKLKIYSLLLSSYQFENSLS